MCFLLLRYIFIMFVFLNCTAFCIELYKTMYCHQEMQLSKLLGSTLSFMALLGFHGYILTKFYRRKRRQETYNNNLNKKGHRNQQKVSFSSEESVKINQIVTRRLDTRDNQKVARRLSELSFHVSYIKSSNYIILTLSAFCFCHLPMYFHQLFELIR